MKKLILALSLFFTAVGSAVAQEYVAGKHFDVISPALRTSSSDRIEVVEFFAYSCGHC